MLKYLFYKKQQVYISLFSTYGNIWELWDILQFNNICSSAILTDNTLVVGANKI